jgi:hypothetical protein
MRPLQDKVYHGCGHFWVVATLLWDDGSELIERWHYISPKREVKMTMPAPSECPSFWPR